MKILLLGPNGQLGEDLRRHWGTGEDLGELATLGRDQLDLSDPGCVVDSLADVAFDVLINTTGYHATDAVEANANLGFAVNAFAVRELGAVCAKKGARFVHISTDYVFGGDASRTQPLTETDATAPVNVYGASKAMGETLARAANPNVTIVRVASLFGVAGASGKGGNFVETMIRLARERGQLKVVSDQIMSPTATADVAQMLVKLLRAQISGQAPTGIYHAVNTGRASWYEFAKTIIQRVGIPCTIDPCTSSQYPTLAMRPPFSALNNAKLSSIVGPIAPWQDALDRYLAAKGHLK